MKSAIRNALLVASGALISVPLSVMGIAAADSSGDQDPPVQHVIHSWDGVMPNFNLEVVGSAKQGQGTVVRNFVNNSNTTTVQQLATNTNNNANTAVAEGGAATGGAAQSQLIGGQAQTTIDPVIVPGPVGPIGPIGPAGIAPAADGADAAAQEAAPQDEAAAAGTSAQVAPADDAVAPAPAEAPAPTAETSGVTDAG